MSFAHLEEQETPVFGGQYPSCNDMLITSKPMLGNSMPAFEDREREGTGKGQAGVRGDCAGENPEDGPSLPVEVVRLFGEFDRLEEVLVKVKKLLAK